jgi:asparagine N-glycosylation enzyme membrane subunit Stt3
MAGFGSSPSVASAEPAAIEAAAVPVVREISAQQLRQMQISEFCVWLRTQTNKHKRPFQEQTITDYAEPARALDRWMTEQEIDDDFTACDVAVLNTFFAQYRAQHG